MLCILGIEGKKYLKLDLKRDLVTEDIHGSVEYGCDSNEASLFSLKDAIRIKDILLKDTGNISYCNSGIIGNILDKKNGVKINPKDIVIYNMVPTMLKEEELTLLSEIDDDILADIDEIDL